MTGKRSTRAKSVGRAAPTISSGTPLRIDGFRASGVHCGLKAKGPDLALIVSDEPASVAGVFTQSSFVGAPVTFSRERVRSGQARGVVVSTGFANVGLGERGLRDAEAMAGLAAKAVGGTSDAFLVASTGVIGVPVPMERVREGIPAAAAALDSDGLAAAARAICTTDTRPKWASAAVSLDGVEVKIAGIAKGSGMIEPNMATMLGFLLTDVAATPAYLRLCLRDAVRESFNRVTVDGETSTSDMALLFANGRAGNKRFTRTDYGKSKASEWFGAALREVCVDLAKAIARDGEGATKLVEVRVSGAASVDEAERAARRIANSMLVKTAIFGQDPNWGRILQTVGAERIRFELPKVEVRLAGAPVFRHGAAARNPGRERLRELLRATDTVEIAVFLGAGTASAEVWTCDLSYDYVRINAEYHT